mgnify:CR=1 FL=1
MGGQARHAVDVTKKETEIREALEKLIDAVSIDVNGVHGMPLSGNGGLTSDTTVRICDEARLMLSRHDSELERE